MTDPDPSYHGLKYWDTFSKFPGLGNVAFIFKVRLQLLRDTGATLSSFNPFLLLLGIETLHLRIQRHSENALTVAKYLSSHPKVSWINYPGLPDHPSHELASRHLRDGYGALIGFGVSGADKTFINNLKLFSHVTNIGDSKSFVIHPATTTHQQLTPTEQEAAGVKPDFIRLPIGIEDVEDIVSDLKLAL